MSPSCNLGGHASTASVALLAFLLVLVSAASSAHPDWATFASQREENQDVSSDMAEQEDEMIRRNATDAGNDGVLMGGAVRKIECPLSSWYTTKPSIMCQGKTLRKELGVSSAEECEALCTLEERCKSYAYKAKATKCFLKSASCTKNKFRASFESGLKHRPPSEPREYNAHDGMLCDGSTLSVVSVTAEAACRDACDACPSCVAYSFREGRSRCLLKKSCDAEDRKDDSSYVSGILPFADPGSQHSEIRCKPSRPCPKWPSVTPGWVCPKYTDAIGESTDKDDVAVSPYQDILDGDTSFITTYPDRKDYSTCPFRTPNKPLMSNWTDFCIANMRKVGFLNEIKARPNPECPAGWFLCKKMCYTLVQRFSRGPEEGPSYYAPDYMGVEQRCGSCGGARVAFVGEDPDMQKVAAEAARLTINDDKATWVRRFRFLKDPSSFSEAGADPYQPWHRFVTMHSENEERMTYQRYYTGEKDNLDAPQYDKRFRNQEASILCVNTVDRIKAATKTISGMITMEDGCQGKDRHDMWDNDKHRWFPEHNWPFPGH